MNLTILGAGAWGTALARHLHAGGHSLRIWDHDAANLDTVARTHRNDKYLPGVDLPSDLRYETDVRTACEGSEVVVVAVPSKALRTVSQVLGRFAGLIVSVTKGIEYETGLTMSGVLCAQAPHARLAALSGPTLALEVARGVPTAAVAASEDDGSAQRVQELFHRPTFRVYTSRDVVGVELGGALKNVIAIAAGVGDGLDYGDNSKAALVTRAIVEIRRLGVACGARPETFSGLSGLGDLVVTCFSPLSRNRTLGERLGRGEKLADLIRHSVSVAEGYPTTRSAWHLARQRQVDTPIIDEVHAMLYESKEVSLSVRDLIRRASRPEEG